MHEQSTPDGTTTLARPGPTAPPGSAAETPVNHPGAQTTVIPADVQCPRRPLSATDSVIPLDPSPLVTRDPRSAAWAPPPVDRLGPYRLVKAIGKGGMGTVYLAEDTGLGRLVAVKTLLPKLARDSVAKERFLREGRLASSIKSDNVVVVHAVGEEQGVPYLAMEYLKGFSLEELLRQKGAAVSVLQAMGVARQVARGLAAAHEKGLVHRDVKPANIWLEAGDEAPGSATKRYRVKLLDFGMAKPHEGGDGLTRAGDLVGTPLYMSPERAVAGYKPDPRSDLFSLGVVLYRLCTGSFPFAGATTASLFRAVTTEKPVPARKRNPEVPAALSKLIDKMLEKQPQDRPASARAAADVLEKIERELRHGNGPPAPGDELGLARQEVEQYRRRLARSLATNAALAALLVLSWIALIWALLR